MAENEKINSQPVMRKGPMGGPGHGPGAVEKAKDFKGTTKKLIKGYLMKYKIQIIIVIIFAIASTIFTIVGPKILGNATTEIFKGLMSKVTGSGTGIDFNSVGRTILFLLGLYVISAIFSYVQSFIMTGITQKLTYNFRKQISEKIKHLPMSYFDKKTHGEILSVIRAER